MSIRRAPKAVLVTFGDGDLRYRRAAGRLSREARALDVYDRIVQLDLRWLLHADPAIHELARGWISRGVVRGCGYWAWKSSLLRWAHDEFPGHLVHYLDAGHTIEASARARESIGAWLEEAAQTGGLTWQIADHPEIAWTKAEARRALDPLGRFDSTDQLESGFIMLRADRIAEHAQLLREWMLHDDGFLLTDEVREPQDPHFRAHRHDQSVHSLLWKANRWHFRATQTQASSETGVVAARHLSGISGPFSPGARAVMSIERYLGKAQKAIIIGRGKFRSASATQEGN